jgi:two-component system cell cycle response regulator
MLHPDCRVIGWSSALWRSPQICRSPKGENMMVGMPDILNASILIVDDQESNVSLLEQLLRATGYTRVASTMNSQEVCELHRKNCYDLILLDLQMPGMDGFHVMVDLKTNASDSYLPVIVLTAQPAHRLRALQAGAKDFISKPFDLLEVKTRIHNMLEVRLLHKQLENYNKVLEQRVLHDSMTGLPNRDLFGDRLTHAIALAKRHAWTLAVMFLDLDRFKCINDTHGHAVGDGVLKEVAKRMLEHARDEDTVCRNGGDEFLYLVMNPQGNENIERMADVLLKNIAQPIDMGDLQPVIKASIGIAIYPDDGATGDQLIRNADTAMYRAKKSMIGYVFFNALETDTG